MPIYLGHLGNIVAVKCPASQQVSDNGEPSFTTTLEGRRMAQVKAAPPRRSWSLGLSDATTPADLGTLAAFVSGEWGPGPFAFVSADAQAANALTPAVSSCDPTENTNSNVLPGGPMVTPDGVAGRSFLGNGSTTVLFGQGQAPVVVGLKYTASAYVLGVGARVRMNWYGAAGLLGNTESTSQGHAGTVRRLAVTGEPPAGAWGCIVSVTKPTQACRPALTWTSTVQPWAGGRGCTEAVIHGLSSDLVLAVPGATYQNASFTVTEVG